MIRLLIVAFVLLGTLASPALAARGDGPYEPFPDPQDPNNRALRYVRELNRVLAGSGGEITVEQLIKGVKVEAARRRGSSRRAAVGERAATPFRQAGVARASDPPSPASWPYAALAGVLALAGIAVGGRSLLKNSS